MIQEAPRILVHVMKHEYHCMILPWVTMLEPPRILLLVIEQDSCRIQPQEYTKPPQVILVSCMHIRGGRG
jgi:hypothetical protein